MKRIVVIILVICTLLFSGCAVLQAMKEGAKSIKDNVATWSIQYITDDYLTKRGS
ncbi:MAG: hypothetical protein IIW02_01880 [Clostridia bacterium]|nr:hypothetical protein [Clostridia bacterium]